MIIQRICFDMIYTNIKQGTPEWLELRAGRFTASRIVDVMAKTKKGASASRKNYLAELLVERMTGQPTRGFISPAMQWGTDNEPEARAMYELKTGLEVVEVGLVIHDDYDFMASSPDGLIGDDGGVEIKCPNTATHIETLRARKVPTKYYAQIQWNMHCTGRTWWDFVSYDPRLINPRLTMYTERVDRDNAWIDDAVAEVIEAEADLVALIAEMEGVKNE